MSFSRKKTILGFVKKEAVLLISAFAAIISMLFVKLPPIDYLYCIDYKVISCLFCLMMVVCGFKEQRIFEIIAKKAIALCPDLRKLAFAIVFVTFFSSMLITNDVALITFVPLSLVILSGFDKKAVIYIIVMQTVAANIGSSLTPIGNPQNLYIYSYYNFSPLQFFGVTVPFVICGGILIFLSLLFLPKLTVNNSIKPDNTKKPDSKRLAIYLIWFVLSVTAVFNLINYTIPLVIIAATAVIFAPRLFKGVDYSLLLTFAAFFIFVKDISSVEQIRLFLGGLLQNNTLAVSALASQFISNVPAAVLLSGFTENSAGLLLGVDAGGCGTLIASLASVISYKLYAQKYSTGTNIYIIIFLLINFAFLFLLLTFTYFLI